MSLNPLAIEQDAIPEATDWETQYNQFADAAAQREMDLLNEIDNFFETGEKLIGESVENCDTMLKEMAYPVSFNMEEFKTLTTFAQRIKYCSARLPRIGAGSSRIVFQIDDEKCLKLAKNQKGIAQNEAEDDGYVQSLDFVAKVYEVHPQYHWLEMQFHRL